MAQADFSKPIGHKKAQKPSVVTAEIFRAPIGATYVLAVSLEFLRLFVAMTVQGLRPSRR